MASTLTPYTAGYGQEAPVTFNGPVNINGPLTVSDFGIEAGNGAKNGSTVGSAETGSIIHQTKLTLTATPITMRDTEQGGGVKIYDFPEGRILFLGATGTMGFTTTSAIASTLNSGVACNWGVGTVTQSSTTIATTEQNIIPAKAWNAGTTINVANASTSNALAASAQIDGTATAVDAFLNLSCAGATDIDGDATVTCTGTVTITWVNLGDY